MVAIVSGNSIGLNLSSLATLGQRGVIGNSASGRNGEQVYVNIATGNLVVQDRDDRLVGVGGATSALRTYNSQGQFTDDNGDNWWNGLDTKLQLNGTALTAGSSVVRTDRDGSTATYQYDTGRGLYVSTDGAGAYDTLAYDSGSGKYTWTDGDTQRTEVYDAAGRIATSTDPQGRTLTYTWGSRGVTAVSNSDGESIQLDYDANGNVSRVRSMVLVNGALKALSAVSYGYDASNRLSTVKLDLTPDDGSTADGNVYQTTYTYDGTSNRIATIAQTDGSSLSFTYVNISGQYRVASVTDGLGQATSYSYDLANSQTTVTDPLGLVARYTYGTNGQLASLDAPAANGSRQVTTFTYNATGDVTRVVDADGRAIDMEYDASGNQTLQRDARGNTVKRVFDAQNHLLSETAYLVADPDGAGPGLPSLPQTTRYVYDAANKGLLRFLISPEGRVTEYRYDAAGNRVRSIAYAGGTYNVATLTETSVLTESQLASWGAAQDMRRVALTEMAYDFRGQLLSTTAYSAVDATGTGVSGGAATTQYVYDQHGWLLKTVSGTGAITQYSYDGLGRLVATLDPASQLTTTRYDDAGNKTSVLAANGLVTTSLYDKAGRLVSVSQFNGAAQSLGQTTYAYDADGRLLMTQDSTGVRHWSLYDDAGRKNADIDGNGTLTEYVYNRTGQLTETIVYATAVPISQLVDAQGRPTSPALASVRPTVSAQDNKAWRIYDDAGRLIKSVDAAGAVTESQYDGASRVVAVIRYATKIDPATLGGSPTAASVAPPTLAADRVVRNFYDGDGLLRATLDGEGYLSELRYNAAGQLVERVTYATPTDTSLRAAGTLTQLLPAANAADAHTFYFYDARGQQVGEVDAEGYLTERVYDAAGNVLKSTRYTSKAVGTVTANSTLAAIRPATKSTDQITARTYDGFNRVLTETNFEGTVTSYTYDAMGNRTLTTTAVGTTDVRKFNVRYDIQGRVTAELSAEGAAKLTTGQTQAQIDAIWAQYATTYTYDAAGRRTSSTNANGYRTLYFYDADSRLTHTVNALGEVTEQQYNAQGLLTASVRYATRIALSGLTGPNAGGVVNAALTSAIDAIRNPAQDSKTTYTYTAAGLVSSSVDATGNQTTFAYDAFGEEVSRTSAQGDGSTVVRESTYDHRGLATQSVLDPSGLRLATSTVYDAFGRAIRSIDRNGNVSEVSYDRLGRVVTTKDPLGGIRATTYDAFNRTLTQTDALGNVVTYAYSDKNRSVTVTLPGGIVTVTERNRYGQTFRITDGRGNQTIYKYNPNGALIQTDTNVIQTKNTYDRTGQLTQFLDASGNKTTYTYDAAGRVLTQRVDPTGANLTTVYTYDALGNRLTVKDTHGTVTSYQYDQKGQVLTQTVDAGGVNLRTTYAYDAAGRVLTTTSPSGVVTAYTYDKAGRRIREQTDPAGLNLTKTYAYDSNGNAVASTDANGHVTRYVYDANNRPVLTIDANGAVSQTVYDAEGRIVRVTTYATPISLTGLSSAPTLAEVTARITAAPLSDAVTSSVYDANGHLRYTVDGTGSVTELRYDANGNVVERVGYTNRIALANWDGKTAPAVVADPAHDIDVRTAYDDDNRPLFTIDAKGFVTRTVLDGVGNVLEKIAYAAAVPVNTVATVDALTAAVALVANPAKDSHLTTLYDSANRAVWTVDGAGSITQFIYDPVTNNLTSTIRYAGQVAAGQDIQTVVPNPAADVVTVYAYDTANRQIFQVDALGGVTERSYDANGNVTAITKYASALTGAALQQARNTARVDTIRAVLTPSADDRIDRFAYDSANRQVLAINAQGVATESVYDAIGNVVSVRVYAKPVNTKNLPATAAVSVLRGLLSADAANDRIERKAYDAGNRLIYTVDALGYVKQTQYNGVGRIIKTTQYALAIPANAGATPDAISAAVMASSALDQSNTYTYDASGNLVGSTDPMGGAETYTYNGLGKKVTYTNKLGAVWSYSYDAVGRLIQETSPQVTVVTVAPGTSGSLQVTQNVSASVITQYQYDGLGNLLARTEAAGRPEERTTRYEYDALGRQVKTTFPPVGVYSEALGNVAANGQNGGAARGDTMMSLTSETYYDVFGNAVGGKDVAGNRSAKVYDATGNLLYEVDAEGYVTGYTRNAFGEVTRLVRYAARTSLTAAGFTNAAGAPARTAVEAAINASGVDHSLDRAILTTYDKLGRVVQLVEPQAFTYDSSATAGAQYFSAGKTTRTTYDAFGNTVQVSQLRNAVTNTWTTTTNYFDLRGNQIATVDALGYLTERKFDASGNVVAQMEFANAIAAGGWSQSAYGKPTASADDRTTTYVFDQANRKTSETRANVEYSKASDGSSTRGSLTTSYTYDAVGNQTSVTDATGGKTYTYYDALGRIRAVAAPTRTSTDNGSALTPLTEFWRDAYGNVVLQTEYATGATSASLNGYATSSQAGNRYTYTQYDLHGKATQTTDAAGINHYNSYNERGQLAKSWMDVTGNDGVTHTQFEVYQYDKLGQLTHTFDPASTAVLQGGLNISSGGSSRVVLDESGRIGMRGTNQVNLTWSSLINAQGGLVRVEVDYITADTRYSLGTNENGQSLGTGGVASHAASRTVDFGAAQVASGATLSWTDNDAADGGLTGITYVRVWQLDNGQWVSKWEGSPAQANGSGMAVVTQAQAGITDTAMEYNAFGEMVRKGVNGGRQEYFDYDNAGHMWRTNNGDGVDRITLFDAYGNATADIRSAGMGRDDINVAAISSPDAARTLTNARRTDTQYDALGRQVSKTGPERLQSQGGVWAHPVSLSSSLQSATAASNESGIATWSGTNQINLSWSGLQGLGSGQVRVDVDYVTAPYQYNKLGRTNESGTNESGVAVSVPGVARSRSQIVTAEQGAYGTTFAWQDGVGTVGGISQITHVRVYKQNAQGEWVQVIDQGGNGTAGNAIEVQAPADPMQQVYLQLAPDGTANWGNPLPLVRFGDVLRYDAANLSPGNYQYQVITVGRDNVTHITGSGSVSIASPALQTIGTPLSYGAAGAGVLAWQSPGDNVMQTLRYRPAGSGASWQTLTASARGNGLYGVDTSILGAGTYEFELLWTQRDNAAPYAHATGQFVKVAEVPGYWVPQVNYPPIAVGLADGVVGSQVITDTYGRPTYKTDEAGNVIGATPAKLLKWPAATGNVQFLYRPQGGSAWSSLSVMYYGADESGNPAYQFVNVTGLAAGTYEYQVVATDGSGNRTAQGLGTLTLYPQGPGHYETRNVQVQVPVTVTPPDPSLYIRGYTQARYTYPVVISTDESGNQTLGAHYAWQGNVVVAVPYQQTQIVGWTTEYYTVQVPTQGPPVMTTNESGQQVPKRDESGNIIYTTVWVNEQRSRSVPVYGAVTIYPADPNAYMTMAPRPLYNSPVVVGTNESGHQILGAHYTWQGNVAVGVPYTVYQWQTQQQQVWVAGTTPPPTSQSTTPPYTPAYYVNAIPAQYSASVSTTSSTSVSLSASQAGAVLSQVAVKNGDAFWARPVVNQKVDRWGNVTEISDPRSPYWKTTYRYNANNQVIEERKPDGEGNQSGASPVTRSMYDALGRQVAVVDANGNVNGKVYDAGSNVTAELHADTGVVNYRYNAFGNKTTTIDAMGLVTTYTYDGANRLLSATHAQVQVTTINGAYQLQSLGWQNLSERYAYDQAGHLLRQTNGAGETTSYAYDMRGNVLSVTQPMGQTTRSAYDALNRKIAEVDPTAMAATWTYDYFGKVTRHTDIGGAVYSYAYDNARQLIAQSNTRGQSLSYSYDAAGQLTTIQDNALNQTTTYAYDLAGNHVREKTVQGGVVYQDNFLSYDALNRLRDVADGQVHISFQYDNVGNRTYIEQHSVDGNNRSDVARYFKYDAMNRQIVVDGVDAAGNIGQQGHAITYDKNGNRLSDTHWGNRVTTAGGQSIIMGYTESGEAIYSTTPTTFVRSDGYTTETYAYDNLNRLNSVVRDGVQIDHRSYDGAGRVTQTGSGNLPTDYAAKLNEGLPQDQTNGLEVRLSQYDANGRLVHQRTLKSDGALKADINYNSYDAAGNVLQYSVTDYDGGYTNTYTYGLQRFEGYKQSTVSGTSTKMDPGTTTSSYDVNGNLVGITDSTKWQNNRTFVNDVSGHVLMVNQGGNAVRELVVNGEVIGQHGVGVNPVTPRDGNGNPNFSYTADFDFGYQPIVANYPNAAPGSYTVQNGDTLQSIARSAYGDSALWFRIAEANGLSSDRDLRVGQTLNIPNKATGVHNDGSVFKPYDPSKVVGDTTPNLPMPSADGGCGGMGMIITAIIVVVATVFTAGAAAVAAAGVAQGVGAAAALANAGLGGIMAAGGAALTGGVAAGAAGMGAAIGLGGMSTTIAVGASMVGAAVGSMVGQGIGVATGMQDKFSWSQVGLSALSAGVTSGVGGGLADLARTSTGMTQTLLSSAAARVGVASAVTQGIGVATGLQSSFNWKGVAAAAAGAQVGAEVGGALNGKLGNGFAGGVAQGSITGFASGMTAAALHGGRIAAVQVATDAFGNALAGSLVGQMSNASSSQEESLVRTVSQQFDGGLVDPLYGTSLGVNPSYATRQSIFSSPSSTGDGASSLYGVYGPPVHGSFGDGTPTAGVFNNNDQSYTVAKGDTVEALARANYGSNWRAGVAAIIAANGLQANRLGSPMLGVGDSLTIPDLQRYADQGGSLDLLSKLGGGVIAGNQRGIDAYNAWQAKQQALAQAAAAQATTDAAGAACTPNNPYGIAAPRTPEEAAALVRSGVLGSVPLRSDAMASVTAYTPTLKDQIVEGVASAVGGRTGQVLAGMTQSWFDFGGNTLSTVANMPSALGALGSSLANDLPGTVGAGVLALRKGFQNAVYGDGRAMGSFLFNLGTTPVLGEVGMAGWEATAGVRTFAKAGLSVGAEAIGPTLDAMASRYPLVFGPRMSIMPEAPSLVGGSVSVRGAVAANSELGLVDLDPSTVRFSQTTVKQQGATITRLVESMQKNGFVVEPDRLIDVVRMPDGQLTSLDNTRILAAQRAGVSIKARLFDYTDPLPNDLDYISRFIGRKGEVPTTYGDAVMNRIGKQSAVYRNLYPYGSPYTGSAF